MNYFWAFVTGGAICVVGQLLLDLTALTPARTVPPSAIPCWTLPSWA